jgi:adenine-specific DNA-methyltransferase
MTTQPDTLRINLESMNVVTQPIAELAKLFPSAFTEDRIDFAKLRQLLGDDLAEGPERFGLSWSGKSDAIKAIQTPTTATLLPARDESVNFDVTENLIIEGDNLEVLKLLQGGYHGRVKMIYIDPPYNTGGEFIYPDNYKEGLADYLKFSGQVTGEGVKLTTNAETDGRYHSKWLTMMYPRLFLARNLLREDGVIFVSIDDHEVHNLRAIMNEIFGEENFVGTLIWKRRQTVDSRAKTGLSSDHEYVLIFTRENLFKLRGQEIDFDKFSNPDNDPRGLWWSADLTGLATREQRPNLHYDLLNPDTGLLYKCPDNGWRYSRETMSRLIAEKKILWPQKDDGRPRLKRFKSDRTDDFTNISSVLETVFTTQGTRALKEIFYGAEMLDFPKPVELMKLLIDQVCSKDDLILDFFAGSGTTGQAVLELNAQDGGNRKFILVQLPEPTERKDFPTIAEITKERVRRVIKKLEKADDGKLPVEAKLDRGFKVFKLGSSNFKVWDAATAPKDAAGLAEQLKLMAHNVEVGRLEEALLYELILKSNLPVTSRVVSGQIGKQTFYDVADGTLAICLERKITQETLRGMMARKPKGVICLDTAFAGNDQLKTNIVLEMKSHQIEFHTA